MENYFYNENGVRFNKVQASSAPTALNWLFIPGGPGADSSYLNSLVEILSLPGNIILVDLPGNGSNKVDENYNSKEWLSIFIPMVASFKNVILVAHSFGAVLPLLFLELEKLVKGFIILNSYPSLDIEEIYQVSKDSALLQLPEKDIYLNNPNQYSFDQLIQAALPYYFTHEKLEKGKELFKNLDFPYKVSLEWKKFLQEINFNAKWVPQNVKTFLIGGENDIINPFSIFLKDQRFERDNIRKFLIKDAGHWCWIDKPEEVKKIFEEFISDILS